MNMENFTKVPNEILEEIARNRSFCAKTRILAVILRKTAGWNKQTDWISLSQFENMTGILKRNVCRALEELRNRKIILKSENKYCINPTTKAWKEFSKLRPILKSEKGRSQNREKPFSNMTPTKETLTKNNSSQNKKRIPLMSSKDFEIFWKSYPKKTNKKKAREKFLRLKKSLLPIVLEALEKQKSSSAWKESNGQFIPYPTSWLNGERWDDDIEVLQFNDDAHGKNRRNTLSGHVSTQGHADLVIEEDD